MNLVTLFYLVDEFCKVFEPEWHAKQIASGERKPIGSIYAGSVDTTVRQIPQSKGVARVGIGTATPTDALTVAGNVRAHVFITDVTADLAEYYQAADGETLSPGTIVRFNTDGKLTKATPGTNPAGVVSTAPGISLAQKTGDTPLALAGRVPVKVTSENGNIKIGDPITVSREHPGVGMKATYASRIVGYALEDYTNDNPDDIGAIKLFVQPETYLPGLQGTSTDDLQGDALSVSMLNVSGPAVITNLTVTGNATIQGNLTVNGTLKVARAEVTNSITVGGHMLSQATDAPVIMVLAAAGQDAEVEIDGTDTAGTITIRAHAYDPTDEEKANGETPKALEAGEIVEVVFAQAYDKQPRVVISPLNLESSRFLPFVKQSKDGFRLATGDALEDGVEYKFNYVIVGADVVSSSD